MFTSDVTGLTTTLYVRSGLMRWWFALLLFVASSAVVPCIAASGTAERAAAEAILETGTAKRVLGDISRAGRLPKGYIGETALTPGGQQADLDFRVGAMKWVMAHPNADPIEREQFLAIFGAKILAGFTQYGGYMRPSEAVKVNEVVLPNYSAPQPQVAAPQPRKPSLPIDVDKLIDSITLDDIRQMERERQTQAK